MPCHMPWQASWQLMTSHWKSAITMAINQYSLEAMIVICVAHTFFAYTFATNAKASLGIHYPFSVDWSINRNLVLSARNSCFGFESEYTNFFYLWQYHSMGIVNLLWTHALCENCIVGHALTFNSQHLSYGGCLEVKWEYHQNCCVLCCVRQLCTMVRTQMWAVFKFIFSLF